MGANTPPPNTHNPPPTITHHHPPSPTITHHHPPSPTHSPPLRIPKCHVVVPNDGTAEDLDPLLTKLWPHVVDRAPTTLLNAPVGSLRQRWKWLAVDVLNMSVELASDWWRVIHDKHCEAHRYYHTLSHLSEMLFYADQFEVRWGEVK